MPTQEPSATARFIAVHGIADALLRDHLRDSTGHCRRCTTVWPCDLHYAAQAAQKIVCTRHP